MKRKVIITAALALSLPIAFGSPASAGMGSTYQGSDPVYEILTLDDATYDLIADGAQNFEDTIGIADPSAPSG